MKQRAAVLEFDKNLLYSGFCVADLKEVLEELPEDARILCFFEGSSTATSGIVIQHSKYKETEASQCIPRIVLNTKTKHEHDEEWVEYSLDESKALDLTSDYFKDNNLKSMQEEINKLYSNIHTSMSIMGEPKIFNDDYICYSISNDQNLINKIKDKSGQINVPMLEIGTTCEHESKHYVGFTQEYNYCTKCNIKL